MHPARNQPAYAVIRYAAESLEELGEFDDVEALDEFEGLVDSVLGLDSPADGLRESVT